MQTASVSAAIAGSGLVPTVGSKELGQDAFLRLLVTQLRQQDPLNPMDSTQFTAQLAQFASLEQLTKANKSLENVLIAQIANTNLTATSLVGKTVKAAGDTISVEKGKASPITYTLPQQAASVILQIYDAKGALVKILNKGAQHAGDQQVIWDGKDEQGRAVPDGTYTVKAIATSPQGEAVGVTLYQTGKVTGVKYDGGVAYLLLGEQKVQMGQVLQVYGPQNEPSTAPKTL
jgi:flagellar basal-body rod modification protein FlgD